MLSTLARNSFGIECSFNLLYGAKLLSEFVYFRCDDGEKPPQDDIPQSGQANLVLTKPESSNNVCIFRIIPLAGCFYHIEAVDIVCSARHLEVYALNEAYMETSEGIRVDEVLGLETKTFMLQYSFEKPVPGCILKLPKMSELSLYSMHVTVVRCVEPLRPLSALAAGGVNPIQQLIGSLCSQSTQSFNAGQQTTDFGALVSSFLARAGSKTTSFPSKGCDQPSTANIPNGNGLPDTQENEKMDSHMVSVETSLKSYMDQLVSNLEQKIMLRLDKIEQMISGGRANGLA